MKANWIKSTIWVGVLLLLGISGYGCGSSGGLDDVGGGISLSASPTAIPADGKSSSVITAIITTTGGVPVAIGTQVTFNTTLGKFSNNSTVYTATTGNTSGTLTVTLISANTEGKAQVTCSAGGATQMIEVYFGNSVATISLTASGLSIPADGLSFTTITAALSDLTGAPVPMGTSVTFSTTMGVFSNNSKSITVSTSGQSGTAQTNLFAGTTPGTAQVKATSGGLTSQIFIEFLSF